MPGRAILRIELQPPFGYLSQLIADHSEPTRLKGRLKRSRNGKNKTSGVFAGSLQVSLSAPTEIRTPVLALRGPRPGPLDDGGISQMLPKALCVYYTAENAIVNRQVGLVPARMGILRNPALYSIQLACAANRGGFRDVRNGIDKW